MKILFFHDDCKTMGGANTYRKELCRILESLGHELYLYTLEPDLNDTKSYFSYKFKKGNRIIDHFKYCYFNPSLYLEFKKVLKKIRPDIIHIHINHVFPNSVLLACGNIPVVQTLHDCRIFCPGGKGITTKGNICERSFSSACYREGCISRLRYYSHSVWRRFNRFIFKRKVKVLISPSMALKKGLSNYGLKSVYIPNYVDTSTFIHSSNSTEKGRILCACQLFATKGVNHLLMAFQNVLMKIPYATLDIVGEGPEKEDLEKLCISLNLQDHVKFHGKVAHNELSSFYSKASVVVVPSMVAENCPLVVLEAMASAKPVIGSRIGGIPELIQEKETGLLFTPGDTNELSEKIVQLLLDTERARKMGELGRARVEKNFLPQEHIKKILDIYYSLVKK
ncbi:MAG: glycosyltransferase family 4 protein [Nitrospirae bacterium]|nr:glycosyltransferase family 4 protein [Nitrospirota bacterium]